MRRPEELVGLTLVDADGRELMVVGPSSWSPTYTELVGPDGYQTVRSTALLQTYFTKIACDTHA